ncbi:MAG TPA: hypothetical protein VHE80_08345, partial [Acidimicrobiales bacterium]|nr:hypothetical protein [Acidimicrobiales bacterium]
DAYCAMVDQHPEKTSALLKEASARFAAVGAELGHAHAEITRGHLSAELGDLAAAERQFAAGAAIAERMGNDAIKGRAMSLQGLIVLARGDAERAMRLVIDGARANRRGGQRTSMAYSTDGLAAVALEAGQPAAAARALAAGAALREHLGYPPSPAFPPVLEALARRCRAELGDEDYEATVAEGRSWDVEDAIDRTLEVLVQARIAA